MRRALAFLSFVAIAAPTGIARAETPSEPAALTRKGCIDVDLDRERLAALARAEGWRRLQASDPSGGAAQDVEMYRAPEGRVTLVGEGGDISCAVMIDSPNGPWRDNLATLAAELGLQPLPSPPGGEEVGLWAALENFALSYVLSADHLIVTVSQAHFSIVEDGADVTTVETSGIHPAPQ
jgi:hypothetical protein